MHGSMHANTYTLHLATHLIGVFVYSVEERTSSACTRCARGWSKYARKRSTHVRCTTRRPVEDNILREVFVRLKRLHSLENGSLDTVEVRRRSQEVQRF